MSSAQLHRLLNSMPKGMRLVISFPLLLSDDTRKALLEGRVRQTVQFVASEILIILLCLSGAMGRPIYRGTPLTRQMSSI